METTNDLRLEETVNRRVIAAISLALLLNACTTTTQPLSTPPSQESAQKPAIQTENLISENNSNKLSIVFDVKGYRAIPKTEMGRHVLGANDAFEVSVHSLVDTNNDGKYDTVKYKVTTPEWNKLVDYSLSSDQIEIVNSVENVEAELQQIEGYDNNEVSLINDKLSQLKKNSKYSSQSINYYDPNKCIAFDWWCVFWNAGPATAGVIACFGITGFLGVLACGSYFIGSGMYNVIFNCGTYVNC